MERQIEMQYMLDALHAHNPVSPVPVAGSDIDVTGMLVTGIHRQGNLVHSRQARANEFGQQAHGSLAVAPPLLLVINGQGAKEHGALVRRITRDTFPAIQDEEGDGLIRREQNDRQLVFCRGIAELLQRFVRKRSESSLVLREGELAQHRKMLGFEDGQTEPLRLMV